MSKLDYNYHSHTYRCGHACGQDEEYVKTAIDAGFLEYGISDHILLPGIVHPNMRGTYDELDEYVKSFYNLKQKYKSKINIKIGFEAEYMDQYKDYYKSLLDSHKIDYLILGQHCYYEDNKVCWYLVMNPITAINKYTDDLIKGIASGLFSYVAHPDMFCIFYNVWDELAISCSKRIIEASIKYNCPLEINLCKARAKKYGYIEREFASLYPFIPFWKLVAKTNAHVVVGVDTHNPKHNLMSDVEYVEELIKQTGVKVDYNYRLENK